MNAGDRARAALMRVGVNTLGRLSDGLRLCLDEGLTAGKTVDYVYRNEPSGRLWVGKLIDAAYLGNPAWEAVRERRRNLERLLADAVTEGRNGDGPIHVVDIASGPALYILSVLQKVGPHDIRVTCSDLDERWLEEGAREAAALGLDMVSYERGDAFDEGALAARRPDVVVASGFYDWITDDGLVRKSFGQVFRSLPKNGSFVLTNQVDHPDLEFVSAVFQSHEHEPLRMKMRQPEQISSWLKDEGFEVIEVLVDKGGFYSCTRVRKP